MENHCGGMMLMYAAMYVAAAQWSPTTEIVGSFCSCHRYRLSQSLDSATVGIGTVGFPTQNLPHVATLSDNNLVKSKHKSVYQLTPPVHSSISGATSRARATSTALLLSSSPP